MLGLRSNPIKGSKSFGGSKTLLRPVRIPTSDEVTLELGRLYDDDEEEDDDEEKTLLFMASLFIGQLEEEPSRSDILNSISVLSLTEAVSFIFSACTIDSSCDICDWISDVSLLILLLSACKEDSNSALRISLLSLFVSTRSKETCGQACRTATRL